MKVALDATPLSVSVGGIKRYTAELSLALASQYPEDDYWLLSDQPYTPPDGLPMNLRPAAASGGPFGQRWWSFGLARALHRVGADVFHGTDFAVPYFPLRPSVMTLHDLSPWKDPAGRSATARVRRRTPFLLRLGQATMVITPTARIRREALGMFGLSPARTVAIPLAAARHFQPVESGRRSPYFLYVGTLEPRKNVPLIVECWRQVRQSHDVDLLLAGPRSRESNPILPEPGLEILGEVPDRELPALYSGATAALYPSIYEGFGLPVLEAMSCGAPVLTSTDPSIREVAGDAALRLDPADRRAWTGAMIDVLENSELRVRLKRRSLDRSTGFSWASTARQTREVYQEATQRFGR